MPKRRFLYALTLLLLVAGSAIARGPWRASEGNTSGWHFMSPEERIAHQTRIRSFRSFAECQAYREEHHALMAARAREQGLRLPAGRRDFCAHLAPTVEAPPSP